MIPVADFHCDLLSYLASSDLHHYNDEQSRCSIPLLKQGGVFLQTCAIFTETNESSVFLLEKQLDIFESLICNDFLCIKEGFLKDGNKSQLHFLLSIENASGLCLEKENFHCLEIRLASLLEKHKLCYIGLVWNQDNRFGSSIASSSNRGLSSEGKEVLRLLDRYSIPIDISHSSDKMVEDIFDFIDINNLKLVPIASHSNFRDICKEKRNLLKEYAQEVVNRGGLIGLNFYQRFVGENFKDAFLKHIFYAKDLFRNLNSICFGSDFFYSLTQNFFDKEFNSSACFPKLKQFLDCYLTDLELDNIFYKNLLGFLCQQNII